MTPVFFSVSLKSSVRGQTRADQANQRHWTELIVRSDLPWSGPCWRLAAFDAEARLRVGIDERRGGDAGIERQHDSLARRSLLIGA